LIFSDLGGKRLGDDNGCAYPHIEVFNLFKLAIQSIEYARREDPNLYEFMNKGIQYIRKKEPIQNLLNP
jgi:hypothetical protein